MTKVKRDNVYLYSRYRGRFDVFQGDVRPSNYTRDRYSQFVFMRNGKESHLQCSNNPGVIHHSVLWLPIRDDKLARKLFIEHEEDAIQALKDNIEQRKLNIKQIKETEIKYAK